MEHRQHHHEPLMPAPGDERVDPTDHRLFAGHNGAVCAICGELANNPARCPSYVGHRTRVTFRVEAWEDFGDWVQASSAQESLAGADQRLAALRRRFPDRPMRIVAETTSFSIVSALRGDAPTAAPHEHDSFDLTCQRCRQGWQTAYDQAQLRYREPEFNAGQTPPVEGDQVT